MIMDKQNLELLKKIPLTNHDAKSPNSQRAFKNGIKRFDNNNY